MFKSFSPDFLSKYKNKQPNWGFNGLGYIVFKRTYARKKEDDTSEEWWETIARSIEGAQEIGAGYTKEEAEQLYDLMFNLKCNYAGRMLWQLGTNVVRKFGGNSLLNCWFTSIRNIDDFCFLFENLMLGGGVGFSVKSEDIHELPRVKRDVFIKHELTKDANFIVPDSREGFILLLRQILKAYFIKGKSFTYSTILVRGQGEDIRSFGGQASGPKLLVENMDKIVNVLRSREGKKLRSIDVLDICNIIGMLVVSGNVRRSAEVALGDPDDYLFLRAKRWDLGNIPNWRAMSNNTIYADEYSHIMRDVWDGYNGQGEPYGFINLPLAQKMGRLGEPCKDPVDGANPCVEIFLSDKECCNLAELYLNNITSKEELITCAKLLYKTQKAVASMNFIHEETTKVVHKNMRLGLGVTGICQSIDKLEWLDECYKELRKFDKQWSKERGWNESIKLSTCKPSGTLSLLSGSTPGIHPAYSQHYIRRVRIGATDPLVAYCRSLGYPIEFVLNFDGSYDHNTCVVSFPCESSEQTILAKDMSAIQQLEMVKNLQTIWSDNSISVTVYYKKEELTGIKEWLKHNYDNSIKSVSFLLHSDHGFAQPVLQEITKEEYTELTSKLQPIHIIKSSGEDIEGIECASGVCPVK